jgi:hypothetical protein
VRRLQRSRVFAVEIFPHRGVLELCAGDKLNCARVRRLSSEHFFTSGLSAPNAEAKSVNESVSRKIS